MLDGLRTFPRVGRRVQLIPVNGSGGHEWLAVREWTLYILDLVEYNGQNECS